MISMLSKWLVELSRNHFHETLIKKQTQIENYGKPPESYRKKNNVERKEETSIAMYENLRYVNHLSSKCS